MLAVTEAMTALPSAIDGRKTRKGLWHPLLPDSAWPRQPGEGGKPPGVTAGEATAGRHRQPRLALLDDPQLALEESVDGLRIGFAGG